MAFTLDFPRFLFQDRFSFIKKSRRIWYTTTINTFLGGKELSL